MLLCSVCMCIQYEREGPCVSQRNSGPLALPSYTHSHYGLLPGNCTCCFYLTGGPRAASTDWENAPLFKQLWAKLPLTLSPTSVRGLEGSRITVFNPRVACRDYHLEPKPAAHHAYSQGITLACVYTESRFSGGLSLPMLQPAFYQSVCTQTLS